MEAPLKLNLPAFDIQLRVDSQAGQQVYDRLRQRWVALTPEEWVRQHFVNHLISDLGYLPGLMANEIQLKQNGRTRRCDTVVFDRRLQPLVIVEYKRSTVTITQKVFDQIARYNSVLQAPWLIVSNGVHHYCCRFDFAAGRYSFVPQIPPYSALTARQEPTR